MKLLYTTILLSLFSFSLSAQTNILNTNSRADEVLKGNYNALDYLPSTVTPLAEIPGLLQDQVSPDSLKKYLEVLSTFQNRNTGSDTVSQTTGIGAARRWVYQKFQEFSSRNENRLLTAYLQFDQDICGMGQHRNIFTVLPGTDPTS